MSIPSSSKFSKYLFDPNAEVEYVPPILEDFLWKGDLVIWLGREKHRKTNVVLQAAICAALGRDFLRFRFTAQGPQKVLIADYESKKGSLKRRYEAICNAMGLSNNERALLKDNLKVLLAREMQKAGESVPRFPMKRNDDPNADDWWCQLVEESRADVYILDPLRCVHAQDENDSKVEQLLAAIRKTFKGATVILPHHLRKRSESDVIPLTHDMRVWSDNARGSVAFKAHADVIVCQERTMEGDAEVLHLGAFLKDAADVEPIALEESGHETFLWRVRADVPAHLQASYKALCSVGSDFSSKRLAVDALVQAGVNEKTAYRHLDGLRNIGAIQERDGQWSLVIPPEVRKAA